MELGLRLKTKLTRRAALGVLHDPDKREEGLRSICATSARLRDANPSKREQWQAPVVEAAEKLAELDLDEAEAYRIAVRVMPEETLWRQNLLKLILPRPEIAEEDMSFLEEEAVVNPRKLALWQRLFEESSRTGNGTSEMHIKEQFTIALSGCFPAGEENRWYDMETETQARSMFFNALDEVLDEIDAKERIDSEALQLVKCARGHFPHRADVKVLLARILQRRGQKDAEALGVILEAILLEPNDSDLRVFAGEMLLERSGHQHEGVELLQQVWQDDPNNERALELLAGKYIQEGNIEENNFEIIKQWFDKNPTDADAAALVADYYVAYQGDSSEASDALSDIVRLRPSDSHYTRLLAERRLKEENWESASALYEGLYELLGNADDVVIPLAIVYAHLDRKDGAAIEKYKLATAAGCRDQVVSDLYCRALYERNPEDLEALEAFHRVFRNNPRCIWAAMGVATKELSEGNSEGALQKLTQVLQIEKNHQAIALAAEIIGNDPRRNLLRQIISLPPDIAILLFEQAAERQPDSLNILANLAKYRLSQNMHDEETEKLLALICKRDPEEVELRLARADLLYEKGDVSVAIEIYKKLLQRARDTSSGSTGVGGFLQKNRERIHERIMESLMKADIKDPGDLEYLIQAGLSPTASPEMIVEIACKVKDTEMSHPLDLPLYEKALAVEPDSNSLEMSCARARARRGHCREIIQLALKNIEDMNYDPEAVALLSEAADVAKSHHITDDFERRILQIFETRPFLPDRVACELARLLVASGKDRRSYRMALRRVSSLSDAPPEILEALERCRQARD